MQKGALAILGRPSHMASLTLESSLFWQDAGARGFVPTWVFIVYHGFFKNLSIEEPMQTRLPFMPQLRCLTRNSQPLYRVPLELLFLAERLLPRNHGPLKVRCLLRSGSLAI
jgi:hypothetical protein